MNQKKKGLIRDLIIIAFSIFIAILLAETGVLKNLITSTQQTRFLGSFVAGILFTSIFTTAPATVALGEIAQSGSVVAVAIIGGLGALIGDLIIFHFVRDRISQDFSYLVKISKSQKLVSFFKPRIFSWLISLVGALIVASPFPDEIGLAMMGLTKMKTSLFMPLSFLLNSGGILIIGLVAKSLL
jgi:hypothetical protein